MDPKIAIVGAGNVGGALGARFSKFGYSVRYGTKEQPVAEAVKGADIVFVALPASVTLDVMKAAGDLTGKIVVDCTNPVGPGITHAPPPEGSVAAALAKALPGARVVKAFNVFGKEFHEDPQLAHGLVADVPIASDDADAKAAVSAIAERCGFAPMDAGPLRNAALLESLAILWIHVAMVGGRGRTSAWKLVPR
jgi:8-hydroxy-5-deazaflavin:NADPH oxidoreductase